jgi:hypothetical protein
MEILVSTDFMERTVKMEIQALRVFRAIRENLVFRELLALQELMVRMAHRELVDRREVQDHLARLVPLVIIDYFKSSNFFFMSPFQFVLISQDNQVLMDFMDHLDRQVNLELLGYPEVVNSLGKNE